MPQPDTDGIHLKIIADLHLSRCSAGPIALSLGQAVWTPGGHLLGRYNLEKLVLEPSNLRRSSELLADPWGCPSQQLQSFCS